MLGTYAEVETNPGPKRRSFLAASQKPLKAGLLLLFEPQRAVPNDKNTRPNGVAAPQCVLRRVRS